MALVVGDILRVDYFGLCFNQRIILTTAWKVDTSFAAGGTVFGDLAKVLDIFAIGGTSGIAEAYLACLMNSYTMTQTRAQVISPTRSTYRVTSYAADNAGSAGAGTVANDSAVVTLVGPNAGRHFISNKHIGPVPDSASANGLITNAFKLKLGTLATAMTTRVGPQAEVGFLTPIILTKPVNLNTTIVGIRIGDTSRVMRRRTVGVGE